MGKMNVGRVILGGLVAGIVADILGYLVDGVMLANRWAAGMAALGKRAFAPGQMVWFEVLGIVTGVVAVWMYAAIRPRFGAGVKTAIYAGVAVWILGWLVPNAGFMYVPHLFSAHLTLYTTLGGIVEIVIGTIAGAALYKEGAVPVTTPVAGTPQQTVRA
ncbi:MAG TPA: hypothetical protein VME86_15950 [Acidobacteriaceae bacterium]|nr:hypothetical protein [Acidobacteriaceae bacterium]